MALTLRLIATWRPRLLASLAGLVLLGGCATGQNFSAESLASLQPGRTTMTDAIQTLRAMPQQVMPQSDGSTVAIWAYKMSVVADALYFRREAMLQFGADGRLARVLNTTNVPLSDATRQRLLGATSIPQEGPATPVAAANPQPETGAPGPGPGATAIPVRVQ
ncbi:hypothetical protein CAL14_12015 [Bordetella genomosp. 9]|uniref:hypothetical protein n=1 Tax=Bordetella genomosp. 9 TaxID=1416803 RepID=UPI000A28D62C|nr:hypothetical protein [Bordetella genomosp. 9]ARP90927.1 hypothetical protein CAL14_12015 [Bordetella genomosp. 9]